MALIVTASLFMVPIFRDGWTSNSCSARGNQAFLTEYVAGMAR
jgi:hypothetical protein